MSERTTINCEICHSFFHSTKEHGVESKTNIQKTYEVEVIVKLKYKSFGVNETESLIEQLEESELELMLDKDMKDCTYTDNQSCRFDDVEVILIKATELKKENKGGKVNEI